MKKKVLSVVLAFTLVLGSIPMTSFVSADSTDVSNVTTEPTDKPDTGSDTPPTVEDDSGKTENPSEDTGKTENPSGNTGETKEPSIADIYNMLKFQDKTYDGNTTAYLAEDSTIKSAKDLIDKINELAKVNLTDDKVEKVTFNFGSKDVSYYNKNGKDYYSGAKQVITKITLNEGETFTDEQKKALTNEQNRNSVEVTENNENRYEIVIKKGSAAAIKPIVISYKITEKIGDKVYDGTNAVHSGIITIYKDGNEIGTPIDLASENTLQLDDTNKIQVKATFDSADIDENKKVTVNLSLVNTEKNTLANYIFKSDDEPNYKKNKVETVNTTAKITPLCITINSAKIYYGQETPKLTYEISIDDKKLKKEDIDKEDKLSKELKKYLSKLNINIEEPKYAEETDYLETGTYTLTIENTNSNIKIEEGTLEVVQNTTGEFATGNGVKQEDGTYKYYYVDEIDLYAPEGYYISGSNSITDFGKESSITVKVEETDNGEIEYYLRDESGIISEKKIFKYSCVKTEPKFEKATVEKVNKDKELFYFQQYGIFTNDTQINITVSVSGGSVYDDQLKMALKSSEKTVEYKEEKDKDNKTYYTYTATWTLYNNDNYEGPLDDILVKVSSVSKEWDIKVDNFTIDDRTYEKIYSDYTPVKIERDTTKANAVVVDGVDWYNIASKDNKETITFDFSDIIKDGNGNVVNNVISGIKEIKIVDNEVVISKNSFGSNVTKSTSWSKSLSDFSDGKHEIVVTATDNVGNESEPLKYTFYVDYQSVTIMNNSSKPAVGSLSNETVNWYNLSQKENGKIRFDFSDIVSGIKEITITDNETTIWSSSFDNNTTSATWDKSLSDFSEGEHKIVITATDNVGNESEPLEYTFYVDYQSVTIMNNSSKPAVESLSDETGGWYNLSQKENGKLQFDFSDAVIVKDENGNEVNIPVSGIKEIKIYDNETTIWSSSFDNNTTSTTWSKSLSEFSEGEHKIVVTAKDNADNESEYFEYTFHVDYQSVAITNSSSKPVIGSLSNETDNWYNLSQKETGKIQFDFSDSVSGIKEITITDNKTAIWNSSFDNNTKSTTWSQLLSDFSEGKHEIVVTATDNVGNPSEKVYTFYVDYTPPKFGTDTVELNTKGEIKEVSGENGKTQWISKDEYIKLKIPVIDENKNANGQEGIIDNAVKYVKVTIQGEKTKTFEFSLSDESSKIESENGGQYVVVSTEGLEPDKEHKYTIQAEIKDLADNTCNTFERIYYQDFSAPEIVKVVVSKVEPSFGTLNLLPFGAYSNTKLNLTISTKDEEYDSGIDYISVTYTDISNQKKTEEISTFIDNTKTKTCDFVFPLDGKVSASDIEIIVYDKYGKKSPVCSNFENNSGENSGNTFVMIEENEPTLNVDMPENDGVKTTDGKIWYKGTDGTDKEITIKVQDKESGLRDMKVTVTSANANKTITLKEDSNKKTFLTTESTSDKLERDNQEHTFILSKNALINNKEFNGADGQYTIKVEVEDNSGNKNTVSKTFYIDKTIPEINSITFSATKSSTVIDSNNISNYIEILDYGYYFKADLTATVSVSDSQASSGLKSVSYQLIDKDENIVEDNSVNITNGKATFSIPKDFKGEIKVNVFDNVHNETGDKSPDALVIDTPAKHGEETHITISNPGKSTYKDSNGNDLYTHDVSLTVTLRDTISGLSEISYSTSAEKGSVATQKFVIENNGNYKKGDKIGGWTITQIDRNLVTEVTQTFNYSSDDNDIIMNFNIIDRAGNTGSLSSAKFTVDKTAPVINVSFNEPNGSGEYYREIRTAEITVTERNFDANRISAEIKNTFGAVPSVNFTKKSNTQYVANVTFKEGDYTFNISGTDRGNHAAKVNYSGKNTSKFYVDLTDPTETDNFNSFKNDKNNSFNASQTMTFSITEHNFNKDLVNIKVYTVNAGQDLNSNTKRLLESPIVWNSNNDVHTTQISFNNDAVYQVEIEVKDLSGRLLSKKTSAVFEIDKTKPILSKNSAQNGKVMTTTSKGNLTEFKDVIFEDANINKVKYTVNVYQKVENAGQGYSISHKTDEKEKQISGVISFTEDIQEIGDLKEDSIYEVKAVAYDDAGNFSDKFICTYVIFEHSTFMAYVSNSSTGKYAFDNTSKRSEDIEDIEVDLYAIKGTDYEVEIDDEEWTEENGGIEVTVDKNQNINQVQCYKITILASKFKEKYSSTETNRVFNFNINADEEKLNLGRIKIDNVEPIGKFDTVLLNLAWYDGFYDTDTYEVKLTSIDSDIDETKVLITDNDRKLIVNDDFQYIKEDNVIKFKVNSGEHKIKVILYDKAGNYHSLDEITIYVGSFWARWWPVLVAGIGVILVAAGIITFFIIKKRKTSV
ncbi:MAG: Ig-like domain repeat protein [Acutalibacteraceae bacterium]